MVLLPITMTALDSDGDILPDAWEDSHSMDKNDHGDASIDFDRDRLSALEEFQLQAEGLGEGPRGKWTTELVNLDFMNRPGSSNNRKEIIDFNDRGDILVNVTSWTPVWGTAPTYYQRVWFFNGSDSTWRKLSTVAGQEPSLLVARDLNNDGIIVGQARAAAANGGVAFGFMKDLRAATFDESVAPWLDAETASVGDLTGINDFGEVIGVDAAGSPFFQSPTEGTVRCPPGWVTPVFTAINNWGEVAGVEYTDYWGIGAPRHFLMTPGWHWLTDFPAFDMWLLDPEDSGLADSFGADFRPTWINDWGEFTGNYWIETENQWWNGSWYFDGSEHDATMSGTDPVVRYRNLLPEAYTHQTVRGLNNWPQILVSGSTNSVEEDPEDFDCFLVNGTQRVALSALSSVAAISDHTYEKSMPVAINNRGTIIGWANFGNSLYLLTLDQDRDGDGMPNDWETFHGLDPNDPSDALDDPDGDGACNLAEFRLGTRPTSNGYRLALDSDADGLPDAWERKMFGNLSANPAGDEDGDGLHNWEEWVIGSDPHLWDSDGDGWNDFEEFFIRGTDASNADTDGDGIPDLVEDLAGSDPKDPDDRPRFPPYLRIEVKTVTNSELIPDEFVTPYFDYWAVHWPLFPEYNEYFSSALATLSGADKLSDPYGDQYPHKITRLVCDYPGTEDYHLKVLRFTVVDGEGESPPQISVETKEFKIPAGQKLSNEIETVAGQVGGVYLIPVVLISDLSNDGQITAADTPLRDAAMASGATDEIKDKGTEFIFHNDMLSNGIWDKEDTDPTRPATAQDDDDAEEIVIEPGITEGEVWLEHPAIAKLSFYKTRDCNAADKVNLSPTSKFTVSASNPFPDKLFMRADVDGALTYPPADPQFAGDLVLKIKVGTNGQEIEAVKMKLTVVKQLGAKKFFHASRDYILENNTKLLASDWKWPIASPTTTIRLCVMREESTKLHPMETYNFIADPEAPVGNPVMYGLAGIESVINHDQEMTVVINGNQCGFSSGMGTAEAYLLFLLGEPEMTDKCQGRIIIEGVLNSASNDHYSPTTNAPGTNMKGSYLAGPDPIPETGGPGGKYFAQYSDGRFEIGTGRMPANFGPPGTVPQTPLPDNGIGGLSGDYELGERANYPNSMIGYHPMSQDGKGVVFAACGVSFAKGNGKVPEFYDAAKASGVPEIPGATLGDGRTKPVINLLLLDSGDTSPALAHETPGGNLKLLLKGSKHNGKAYYTNTYLRFKSVQPRQ